MNGSSKNLDIGILYDISLEIDSISLTFHSKLTQRKQGKLFSDNILNYLLRSGCIPHHLNDSTRRPYLMKDEVKNRDEG